MKTALSSLAVVALLVLPTYIVIAYPQHYNALAQVLFDLLLFAASLWLAVTISSKDAEKKATDKWLPAAETACNELLTMNATIDRMHSDHSNACDSLELIFPNVSAEQLSPVVEFMKMRCGDCATKFGSLSNHIDNSFRNWEVFIENNCAETDCQRIHSRLEERRAMLGLSSQGSFANTSPQATTSQDNATVA